LEAAAVLRPDKGNALYNVACYQSLLGAEKDEVLANLARAINISPLLRAEARTDEDLARFREDVDFKKLMEEPSPSRA
jgi:hypothetical protein